MPITLGIHTRIFVVGMTQDFFDRYQYGRKQPLVFQKGSEFEALQDVVLGSRAATELDYRLGDSLLSHGMADTSFTHHDELPFNVVGILERSGTPIDNALFVSLEAIDAIHDDENGGLHEEHDEGHKGHEDHDEHDAHEHEEGHKGHEDHDEHESHDDHDEHDAHEHEEGHKGHEDHDEHESHDDHDEHDAHEHEEGHKGHEDHDEHESHDDHDDHDAHEHEEGHKGHDDHEGHNHGPIGTALLC